jgi:hypothetical protein
MFIIFCTVKFCVFLYVCDLCCILLSCDKLMAPCNVGLLEMVTTPAQTHGLEISKSMPIRGNALTRAAIH